MFNFLNARLLHRDLDCVSSPDVYTRADEILLIPQLESIENEYYKGQSEVSKAAVPKGSKQFSYLRSGDSMYDIEREAQIVAKLLGEIQDRSDKNIENYITVRKGFNNAMHKKFVFLCTSLFGEQACLDANIKKPKAKNGKKNKSNNSADAENNSEDDDSESEENQNDNLDGDSNHSSELEVEPDVNMKVVGKRKRIDDGDDDDNQEANYYLKLYYFIDQKINTNNTKQTINMQQRGCEDTVSSVLSIA